MEKKITSITFFLLSILWMVSCQQDDNLSSSNVGYLRLQLGVNESTLTKADIPYNPEQMAVQIVNAEGTVVAETTNWATEWKDTQIALPVGTYTLNASSAGFDGQSSGFNKPYYAGSTQFIIEKGKEINATVTCTLANVKVTVNFDESFQKYFKAASVEVGQNQTNTEVQDGSNTIAALLFEMGQDKGSGYFPAVDLQAKVNITNHNDEIFSQTDAIRGVKPRDHYILNYSVGAGEGGIDIDVDETTYVYTFHIDISTIPKTALGAPRANAWAKLAYLEGEVISSSETLNPDLMKLQYRKNGDSEWTDATTTVDGETYKATVTGLQPATEYESRMVYGNNEYSSEATKFMTEEAIELYNGNFEEWCTIQIKGLFGDVSTAYPNASADIKFWDTSNTGANTMSTNDPTSSIKSPIVSGTYAAKLESKAVMGVFAAASLYTGTFGKANMSSFSATLNFGQPFTSRPIALHGYYKYIPAYVNKVGSNLPDNATVSSGGPDECSIYMAMATKSYEIDNSNADTFIDFAEDDNIIAYGALPSGAATSGDGYTEFTIPLKYKNFTEKPTHIIIVCSASKYGDYMTGGEGSTLYVDNFELLYDSIPTLWE